MGFVRQVFDNGKERQALFDQMIADSIPPDQYTEELRQAAEKAALSAGQDFGMLGTRSEDEKQAAMRAAVERVVRGEAERIARENAPLVPVAEAEMPPLPVEAQLPAELASAGSPWLDAYVAFSRKWAPSSYDDFHEAAGLWLLSAVAARRVVLRIGVHSFFPSLYIALCARTSIYTKSTTTGIAGMILREAGLSHLRLPDEATPQAFIRELTTRLPDNFGELPLNQQGRLRTKVGFAAQRAWYYEEFGMKLSAMMRDGGTMADFRSLLRILDDCPDYYEYVTIGRGSDRIELPYLALLANMTPADLQPFAKRGSALWNDGFLSRFALITPPKDTPYKSARFPLEECIIPDAIVQPLKQWHVSLGLPDVHIVERRDEKDKPTGAYDVSVLFPSPRQCTFGEGVFDAYYTYRDALLSLASQNENQDTDGSYSRFSTKALRVAMLLASLDNGGRIEMRHWARAQQIAERWRQNLHNLMEQVQQGTGASAERTDEDRAIKLMARNHPRGVTVREMQQHIRGLTSEGAVKLAESLCKAGRAVSEKQGRKTVYRLSDEESLSHGLLETGRSVDSVDSRNCRQSEKTSTLPDDTHDNGSVDSFKPCLLLSTSTLSTLPETSHQEAANGTRNGADQVSTLVYTSPAELPPGYRMTRAAHRLWVTNGNGFGEWAASDGAAAALAWEHYNAAEAAD